MSPASYALRFATGFDGMMMVLSGMSDMAQMQDNLSFMKDFQPLSTKEQEAVKQVTEIFKTLKKFMEIGTVITTTTMFIPLKMQKQVNV